MRLAQVLSKKHAQNMRRLQHDLRRNMPFRELPDGEHFTVGRSKEVYKKIGNSHSTSTETGKDAIFSLRSRVHRCNAPT